MNLVDVGTERPLRLGGAEVVLEEAVASAAGSITVGLRPEALHIGDGPLRARIRTAEDVGSEVFIHVVIEHHGDSVDLVARMAPPFDGNAGDHVGLQITGTAHLFGDDGMRICSTSATVR
jgi:multiple sugar transport system ATP-binding protein